MKHWKLSLTIGLVAAALSTLVLSQFILSEGIAILIFLYFIVPIISFISGLLLSHRKGWLFLYPIFYTIFYLIFAWGLFTVMLSSDGFDWALAPLFASFAFIPALLGILIGGLMRQRGWLKHPLLIVIICLAICVISFCTNNTLYVYEPLKSPYLLIALPIIFALIGFATGFLDDKGYWVPVILSLFFYLIYSFMSGTWFSYYTVIYLALSYLFLFIGRFWKNRRADRPSKD